MKKLFRFLTILLALALVVSAPATVAKAATAEKALTADDYHDTVLSFLDSVGSYNPESNAHFVTFEMTSQNYSYHYYISNLGGYIWLESLIEPKSGSGFGVYSNVYLTKGLSRFTAYSQVLRFASFDTVDFCMVEKSDYRASFTKSTQYSVTSDVPAISNANAQLYFNEGLQDLMLECDKYLYQKLGFGLKCLGFVNYAGYGPNLEVTPSYAPGDVNGDGTVNNDDVVYLMWHNVFPESYPLLSSGDVNRSGSVNNDDVVTLLWHVLFPTDYPI